MQEVKVTTLKGFLNGGTYVGRGRSITVSEMRARDLEANGLITRKPESTENKKAPDPTTATKTATKTARKTATKTARKTATKTARKTAAKTVGA